MRRVLVDGLAVVAAVDAVGRHGDRDVDLALLDVAIGELEVVPAAHHRRLAARLRGRRGLRRDVVAGRLEVGEELDARRDVVERAAVGERRGEDRGERLAGLARVAAERDHVLVGGILEVGPRLRHGLGDVGVDAERDDAPVVADPRAARVLQVGRDRRPGRHLVGGVEALLAPDLGEGRADVEHVGRALRALLRDDRLVLLRRGAIGDGVGQLHLELALVLLHDLAVVGPRGRQRDRVDRAFLLGLGDQVGERDRLAARGSRVGSERLRPAEQGRGGDGAHAQQPRAPEQALARHALLEKAVPGLLDVSVTYGHIGFSPLQRSAVSSGPAGTLGRDRWHRQCEMAPVFMTATTSSPPRHVCCGEVTGLPFRTCVRSRALAAGRTFGAPIA